MEQQQELENPLQPSIAPLWRRWRGMKSLVFEGSENRAVFPTLLWRREFLRLLTRPFVPIPIGVKNTSSAWSNWRTPWSRMIQSLEFHGTWMRRTFTFICGIYWSTERSIANDTLWTSPGGSWSITFIAIFFMRPSITSVVRLLIEILFSLWKSRVLQRLRILLVTCLNPSFKRDWSWKKYAYCYEKEKCIDAISLLPLVAYSFLVGKQSRFVHVKRKIEWWRHSWWIQSTTIRSIPTGLDLFIKGKYVCFDCHDTIEDPVITILSDNTGLELISDIIFCVFYLYLNRTSTINYIIKESPVFVSDITEYDMKYTIEWLSFHSNVYIQEVSKLLQDFIEKGRFRFIPQYTLGTCLSMWNIPTSLYSLFNESTLIISKGDANYRRFLNDSHWKYDTDCKEVLSYLPTPVVLLRTLKSNCLMGISEDLQKKARQLSQNWDINGIFVGSCS